MKATRAYKHRINQFFKPNDATIINHAVQHVHTKMCDATLLIKYRMAKISRIYPYETPIINETFVLNAIRAVKGESIGKCRKLAEDEGGVAQEARQENLDSWVDDFSEMTRGVRAHDDRSAPSVSHMFGLAAKQYAAAVLSNIRYHFRGYVCKCLGLVLRSKVCTLYGVNRFSDLPERMSKRWKKEFGKAYDDVMFHRHKTARKSPILFHSIIERHRWQLVPMLPYDVDTIDYDLSGTERPYVYLGHMMRMSAFLEAMGERKYLSPIPLKTSFIPAHYQLDTTCIAHLLMNKDKITGFANYFEKSVGGGFPLPGLKDKASICASLEKLRGGHASARDEELYKDALWTYLANFKNRRTKILNPLLHKKAQHPGAMRFGHSISTDGYSVSIITTDNDVRGRKSVYKSAVSYKNLASKREPSEFSSLTHDTIDEVEIDPNARIIGGDPGKNILLMLIDQQGRALRYTGAQRKHDTLSSLRKKKLRGAIPWNVSRVHKDMAKSGASPKSWDLLKIREYIQLRENARVQLEETYTRNVFRAMRFLAWSKRCASVEKFASRILEKYGGDAQSVVIFYGDWGRQPNLKHQAPTPGIGLRRLLHKIPGITTITIRESFTSSYCPRCGGEVTYARECHGILQCSQCSTVWSRDILGAKNILAKGLHIMETHTPHPLFGV
jgi:hypothetical protein